ncbi:Tailless [Gryllus bimaculatus]|nr:Tailless [Gryllus bimaculatus]
MHGPRKQFAVASLFVGLAAYVLTEGRGVFQMGLGLGLGLGAGAGAGLGPPLPLEAVCESAARLLFMNVKWAKNVPAFTALHFGDQVRSPPSPSLRLQPARVCFV